jgi:hypothetical protein
MKKWKRDVPSNAVLAKLAFLGHIESSVKDIYQERWPAQCIELVEDFRKFIFPHVTTKIRLMELSKDPENAQAELEYLREDITAHYDAVLNFFDKAIHRLEEAQPDSEETTAGPSVDQFSTPRRDHNPLKRIGGDLDGLPWAKRRQAVSDLDSSPIPEEIMKLPLPPNALPNKTPTKGEKYSLSHLAKL